MHFGLKTSGLKLALKLYNTHRRTNKNLSFSGVGLKSAADNTMAELERVAVLTARLVEIDS